MSEAARQRLCDLVGRFGPSVIDDPKRCEGLLRDLCADYRMETNVLLAALKERVATELLHLSDSVPVEALLARLSKQLQENHGLHEASAKWAVDSWALALGRVRNRDLLLKRSAAAGVESPAGTTLGSIVAAPRLPNYGPTATVYGVAQQPIPAIPIPTEKTNQSPRSRIGAFIVVPILVLIGGILILTRNDSKQSSSVISQPVVPDSSAPKPKPSTAVKRPVAAAPKIKSSTSSPGDPSVGPVPNGILTVLERWRQTMLSGDVDGQTNCYAPTVELFFRRRNLDRDELREMKRSGMTTYPDVREYRLSDLRLESTSDTRVVVTFRKYWDSYGTKHFYGEEKQRLTFLRAEGDWKIVREEELQIYWVKKE